MRQLSAVTNLVLAGLASVALALSLQLPGGRPGESPRASAHPSTPSVSSRACSTVPGEIAGQDAFLNSRSTLSTMAVAMIVLCALMAVPAMRGMLREVLRALGLITPLAVGYLLVARPGGVSGDLHWRVRGARRVGLRRQRRLARRGDPRAAAGGRRLGSLLVS